jgi:hypothetical protein
MNLNSEAVYMKSKLVTRLLTGRACALYHAPVCPCEAGAPVFSLIATLSFARVIMWLPKLAHGESPDPTEAGARACKALVVLLAMTLATGGAWLGAKGAKYYTPTGNLKRRLRQPRAAKIGASALAFAAGSEREESHSSDMFDSKREISQDAPVPFYDALKKALKERQLKLEQICPTTDSVARRMLSDYGAMYVATKKVLPPPVCIFTSEEDVKKFQDKAGFTSTLIGYDEIELQPEAMKQLLKAREEANKESLDITPRGGTEAARRNYDDTLRLWDTRFLPALDYWKEKGRLSPADITRLRGLSLHEQIAAVLDLERSGVFFSKDFSKSILYSIAAPGASQHIAMLALDITEFDNARVREILAAHGWFQTVLSDLPHFTFLGRKEKELPRHGLRPVMSGDQLFWIPNVMAEEFETKD